MKIYVDSEYCLHVTNPEGSFIEVILSEKASAFFNGKCDTFIEGYRFIPYGESWTRKDGVVFHGEMIVPWKPYSELDEAQVQYEFERIAEYSSVLSEIEATILPVNVQGTITTFVESRKQAIISRINDMITALYTLEVTPVEE